MSRFSSCRRRLARRLGLVDAAVQLQDTAQRDRIVDSRHEHRLAHRRTEAREERLVVCGGERDELRAAERVKDPADVREEERRGEEPVRLVQDDDVDGVCSARRDAVQYTLTTPKAPSYAAVQMHSFLTM